jgi:hypothetical protein
VEQIKQEILGAKLKALRISAYPDLGSAALERVRVLLQQRAAEVAKKAQGQGQQKQQAKGLQKQSSRANR